MTPTATRTGRRCGCDDDRPRRRAGVRRPARAQAGRLAAGELSSRELIERTLSRIAATQPTLNAFRCVRAEAALREADDADRRLAAGERAALLGVPVAIKDDTDLAGETTPFGCAGEWAASEHGR